MHNFRELKIWQRSIDFAVKIYQLTALLPKDEKYNLVHQLKKCAVSIPSNISEGAGRSTNAQFKYFLEISMGSCNEVMTQTELAFRLNFITQEQHQTIFNEALQIYKMILGFYNTLG